MKPFAYVNPANEKEAVAALSKEHEKSMPMGGGQDLLARMKDYVTEPDRIVNVKNLDATVTRVNGGLRIGSAMKMVDVAEHADIGRMYPAVAAAAIEVGTPQIRNQGTVGGNINQRPRCWYFRNEEFVCYKKGGNRCFTPEGENQFHAIFGDGPSYIVHPSSLAVPFVAYDATFRLVGPRGERMVKAADYFTMPTKENVKRENVLEPDELLTHVILPAPRKPMPVMMPWAMRVGSSRASPAMRTQWSSYTVTSISTAEAMHTSTWVRRPAGRPWKERS